jgi:hypothetical protein
MDGNLSHKRFSMSGYDPTERHSFNGEKIWENCQSNFLKLAKKKLATNAPSILKTPDDSSDWLISYLPTKSPYYPPPPPFYTTLVEWPVQQKLYYFLDMQKKYFSQRI